jgi:hypothetical protein
MRSAKAGDSALMPARVSFQTGRVPAVGITRDTMPSWPK